MQQSWKAKDEIIEVGRRLWQRGYVAANDGNLSVRLSEDRILTTPTGVSKGFMTPEMLVTTDLDGRVLLGEGQPSSELRMHLEVYKLRPEICAVVHAHPPVATAFSVARIALDRCVLPESVVTLGAVPVVPYSTPWTEEVPQGIRPHIPRCDAVLLANHGAVTWAETLERAYFKMETLEMTAQVTYHAQSLGRLQTLNEGEVKKLLELREEKGVPGKILPCRQAGSCPLGVKTEKELIEIISQSLAEILKNRQDS